MQKARVLESYDGSSVNPAEQKAAFETSSRLAAIVQSSDDAIIAKDLNGIITDWNRSAERIFGYTEQEALGKAITLIIPPHLQDEEAEILRRIRAGERIDHFETVRIAKGGMQVLVSLTISPVRDSSGRIVGASKIARDITRIKQVEQELRESEQRMRFCLEAANIGTWDWDLKTGNIRWSENMEQIRGQRPGSFGGIEAFLEAFAPKIAQGSSRNCSRRLRVVARITWNIVRQEQTERLDGRKPLGRSSTIPQTAPQK
jgi:PAS domain S-box-containing protein